MQLIHIDENSAGQRVDRFLKKYFPKAPLSFIFKAIRTNKIKVNGKRPQPETILQKKDALKLFFTPEQLTFTHKEIQKKPEIYGSKFYKQNLQIAYEDEDLLILDKPAGIAVHPGTKNYVGQTLLDIAQAYIKHQPKKAGGESVALIHRLDKETSGLVILSKNEFTLRAMNEEIREKRIKKKYLALIKGELEKKQGSIKMGLVRTEGKNRSTKIIPSKSAYAKEAITHYKVIQRLRRFSLLEIKLETGRMHQIRVHFATLGHPLAGDENYGDFRLNRELQKKFGLKRHFLHACELVFTHPRSGKQISLQSPLPEDLKTFLGKISI